MAKRKTEIELSLKDRITRKLKGVSKAVRRIGSDLGGLIKRFAAVGAAVVAFGGLAVFAGAISSAAEFEEQLSKVQAVSRATGEEFEQLRAAAEKAGTETRFTATQAAQALEELARAGKDAAQSVAILPDVLALAQANTIALADAAILTTTTLNQFRLEAEESGRVVDVLTRGSQTAAQTVTELGAALDKAGPVAKQANLTLEETVAVIGKLADVGFRGELGGVAFKNALIDLSDPTTKFREELRKLNITSLDFVEVFAELERQGKASEAALLSLGKRSGPALATLGATGSLALNDLITELNNSGDAAQNAATIMDQNLRGAAFGLASAFDAARRALASPFLVPFADSLRALSTRIRAFVTGGDLKALTAEITDFAETSASKFIEFVKNIDLNEAARKVREFVEKAKENLNTLSADLSEALRATRAFSNAFGLAFNGLQTGILALTGALVFLGTKAQETLLLFLKIADSVSPFVNLSNIITELEISIGAMDATAAAFFKNAKNQIEEGHENWRALRDDVTGVNDELEDTEELAENAGQAIFEAANLAEQALRDEEAAVRKTNEELKKQNDIIADLGPAAKSVFDAMAAGAEKARTGIDKLTKDAGAAFAKFVSTTGLSVKQLKAGFQEYLDTLDSKQEFDTALAQLREMEKAGKLTAAQYSALARELREAKKAAEESFKNNIPSPPTKEQKNFNVELAVTVDHLQQATISSDTLQESIEKSFGLVEALGGGLLETVNELVESSFTEGQSLLSFYDKLLPRIEKVLTLRLEATKKLDAALALLAGDANVANAALREAEANAHLLGEEELTKLRAALDDTKSKLDALSDSAATALKSAEADLLKSTATQAEQEELRHQQKLDDLDEELARALRNGNIQAIQDLRATIAIREQLKLKLKLDQDGRDEIKRRDDAERSRTATNAAGSITPGGDTFITNIETVISADGATGIDNLADVLARPMEKSLAKRDKLRA